MQLREAEPGQRRDEEDPAADAEQPGEHAGDDAEDDGEDVRHWSSIRTPIADEERGEEERQRAHGEPLLERRAARRADTPRARRRAARTRGSTSPWTTYVITPAVAVMPIAASDVAVAARISQRTRAAAAAR